MPIFSADIFPRYAETDQMGVIYHSNYFIWFEYARGMLFEHMGFRAEDISEGDVLYPVRRVDCEYIRPARYGRVVSVSVRIKRFTGVRIIYDYEVHEKETGELLARGSTEHAITNGKLEMINLKRMKPEEAQKYFEYMEACRLADAQDS
ncbi:MAG: thioesterase family protein [Bacillota bacterium]|jgi:acyl-CoA thioester hydrolase|nr:thioesterase family protein [Bacillota bacterium]